VAWIMILFAAPSARRVADHRVGHGIEGDPLLC